MWPADLSNSLQNYIQKVVLFVPSDNWIPMLKLVKKQKSWKCTFSISEKFEHDWSANKHHQSSHKDFAKLPLKGIRNPLKKFPNLHNPSVHQNTFFSPFEPFSEVIMYCMECTWVNYALIHPIPQHVLFNYHATKQKKHTCHHVPKQCFHFMTPQNDPNFHLTILHKNPIHVAMPYWNFTNLVFIQSKSHASSQIKQISCWNNI